MTTLTAVINLNAPGAGHYNSGGLVAWRGVMTKFTYVRREEAV